MEAKLGPLQSVIDQAGVRMAKGEAMKEKNESLVASLQVLYCMHGFLPLPFMDDEHHDMSRFQQPYVHTKGRMPHLNCCLER